MKLLIFTGYFSQKNKEKLTLPQTSATCKVIFVLCIKIKLRVQYFSFGDLEQLFMKFHRFLPNIKR